MMTPHIDDLIFTYIQGEHNLPAEVRQIVGATREAASKGRALEVIDGLRKLRRFHDGAPVLSLKMPEQVERPVPQA